MPEVPFEIGQTMPDNDVTMPIPPGYSEEDTAARRVAKRYEPKTSIGRPVTTDVLSWRL